MNLSQKLSWMCFGAAVFLVLVAGTLVVAAYFVPELRTLSCTLQLRS